MRENLGNGRNTIAEHGTQVAISPAHEVYLLGSFFSSVTLGTTTFTNPTLQAQYYLATLDAQGQFRGARQDVLVQPETCRDMAVSPTGQLIFACTFEGTVTHGRQRFTSINGTNPLVLSFSPLGEFQWGHTTGATPYPYGAKISPLAVDAQGNMYTVVVNTEFRAVSYFPTGALRWNCRAPRMLADLAVVAPDQVLLTGQFENTTYFGAHALHSRGVVDAFLTKLSVTGVVEPVAPTPPVAPVPRFIPNIITPNHDGHNDWFRALGLPVGIWRLRVYSRWGRLVYESDDYHHDWDAAGLTDGLYFYALQRDGDAAIRGWVEVVR